MDDKLIEAMARNMAADTGEYVWRRYTASAEAALAAIREQGYAIVPFPADFAMEANGLKAFKYAAGSVKGVRIRHTFDVMAKMSMITAAQTEIENPEIKG